MEMYKLTDIRPIQLNDLVRIGKQQDGGYVIAQRQIDKTEILLSFGISTDWSFDKDFLHRKECRLYAYDYSVSARILQKHIIKSLCLVVYHLAALDFHTAKERIGFAMEKMIHPFQQFFNPTQNRHFFKKYLGNHDNDEYVSVSTVFSAHISTPPPPQYIDL
jgi:hypothetical protein